jgi:hypothetical protein
VPSPAALKPAAASRHRHCRKKIRLGKIRKGIGEGRTTQRTTVLAPHPAEAVQMWPMPVATEPGTRLPQHRRHPNSLPRSRARQVVVRCRHPEATEAAAVATIPASLELPRAAACRHGTESVSTDFPLPQARAVVWLLCAAPREALLLLVAGAPQHLPTPPSRCFILGLLAQNLGQGSTEEAQRDLMKKTWDGPRVGALAALFGWVSCRFDYDSVLTEPS